MLFMIFFSAPLQTREEIEAGVKPALCKVARTGSIGLSWELLNQAYCISDPGALSFTSPDGDS